MHLHELIYVLPVSVVVVFVVVVVGVVVVFVVVTVVVSITLPIQVGKNMLKFNDLPITYSRSHSKICPEFNLRLNVSLLRLSIKTSLC